MFSKHVSSLASAYCHDELLPEQSRRVAEHLIDCLRCRAECEEVRFGARLAAQLPLLAAPDSLWIEIEVALDRNDRTVPVRTSSRLTSFLLRPRFAFAALALAGLVVAVAVLLMNHAPTPAGASWDVARRQGAPRIGSVVIRNKAKLGIGQWLETDPSSSAQIYVSDIGTLRSIPTPACGFWKRSPPNIDSNWSAAG